MKIKNIIINIIFYFIFVTSIFVIRLPFTQNTSSLFIPELPIILVYIFSLIPNKKMLSYGKIFILGITFDILNLSPIGLTSICWMTSYKIVLTLINYFLDNDSFITQIRNFSIFILINYILKLFLMYFIFGILFKFKDIFILILSNIFWFIIIFSLSNKIKIIKEY